MTQEKYLNHEIITFQSTKKGPRLLVFGGIHGNEICGGIAARAVIEKIQTEKIILQKGGVTFVPLCNPAAHEKNKRFIEANLNRVMAVNAKPKFYEEKLAQNLLPLIETCDVLLDLHSYHTKGPAFGFLDYKDKKTKDLISCLPASALIKGWPELYKDSSLTSGDTVTAAHKAGKIGLVLECGYHEDPASIKRAETAILAMMEKLGLIKKAAATKKKTPPLYTVKEIIVKKEEGSLVKKWKNLETIKKGALLACYDSGQEIRAPYDGVIILPCEDASLGQEWFYLGR